MQSPEKHPHRRVYVLSCWEERSRASAAGEWRFSLEDPHTGERHGFTSLEALIAHLQTKLAAEDQFGEAGAPNGSQP